MTFGQYLGVALRAESFWSSRKNINGTVCIEKAYSHCRCWMLMLDAIEIQYLNWLVI